MKGIFPPLVVKWNEFFSLPCAKEKYCYLFVLFTPALFIYLCLLIWSCGKGAFSDQRSKALYHLPVLLDKIHFYFNFMWCMNDIPLGILINTVQNTHNKRRADNWLSLYRASENKNLKRKWNHLCLGRSLVSPWISRLHTVTSKWF